MDYGQTISNVVVAGIAGQVAKKALGNKKCKGKVFGKARKVKGVLDY